LRLSTFNKVYDDDDDDDENPTMLSQVTAENVGMFFETHCSNSTSYRRVRLCIVHCHRAIKYN